MITDQNNNNGDTVWFCEKIGISSELSIAKKNKGIVAKSHQLGTRESMPRWRVAEEICVEIEKQIGNNAFDVSRQNLGYDVLSEEVSGKKKYIEVKSVKRIGDVITLTNNEYSSAHQYGEQYIICVIAQERGSTNVLYINNPLNNGRLEKRVKMWEWALDNYSGDKYNI